MNFLLKATGLKEKNKSQKGGAGDSSCTETNRYCAAPDVRFPIIAGQSVPNSADVGGRDNSWSEETVNYPNVK